MSIEIKLPNLGENIESGDVLSVLVQVGDEVAADQGVIELETDKATMEVPSPQAGRVVQVLVAEGQTISVGAAILKLDPVQGDERKADSASSDATPSPPSSTAVSPPNEEPLPESPTPPEPRQPGPPPEADSTKPSPALPTTPEGDTPGDGHSSAPAGPAVRRIARELGVDLRRVRGSGEEGRITTEDVQAYVRQESARQSSAQVAGPTPPGTPSSDGVGAVRREKMSRMRQTIARNMTESYTTIPQLTNFDDADVTELEKIRQESKEDYARDGVKLTTMPFLIKAIASSLRKHPVINASVDMETQQIVYKEYINIGVAVDTERGLAVPVLRDVDRMSIPEIARQLKGLAEAARSGDITLDQLRGGTFTISNLGAVGGTYSTPIINPPEVAILLAGRTRKMPVYVGEKLEGRLLLPLSLTYDHRVVDGAAAARFLNEIKGYLSAPGRLLLS
ncbi:MAG: 2-oxo acid dehydrogenase subunit E2 [Planctomycetales bacterium]|nr:2-oxo acid dehydrogenase subunit E2 [Planctomycetales bacterium]